jgi:hypothetical protein
VCFCTDNKIHSEEVGRIAKQVCVAFCNVTCVIAAVAGAETALAPASGPPCRVVPEFQRVRN